MYERSYFGEVFQTLREAQGFLALAVLFFAVGAVAGYLSPEAGERLLESFGEFVAGLAGRSAPELMLIIFLRNAVVALLSILAGVALGVFPLFSALTNGMLFGAVMMLLPGDVWRVIPHGIFELPAIFIAWGLGLWCGAWLFQRRRGALIKDRVRRSLRVFLGLVLPLLLVAAIIEGWAMAWIMVRT